MLILFRSSHFILISLFSLFLLIKCSNWAQTTGKLSQNIVIPRFPTPAYRHWAQRFGHAVVVTSNSTVEKGSVIYLLGGDTYEGDVQGGNVSHHLREKKRGEREKRDREGRDTLSL